MAAAFVVLPACALNEASAMPACALNDAPLVTDGAASEQDLLPERKAKTCRQATLSSDLSTAIADTESEMSLSPQRKGSIVGNVLSLSRCPEGCRRVQDALEKAATESEQELLVSELHGHVIKAMRCPHANHVLQKCISVMPPASLQFMIDELLEHEDEGLLKRMAMNRYGGRIVQQLLRKCAASQVRGLAEALLPDAVALSCHFFGNYVVNNLLEFGTAEQKYSLVRTLERNMETIGRSAPGECMIVAALTHAAAEDRVWIARAAVQDPSLLLHLASGRHGATAVLLILGMLPRQEHARACQTLMKGMAELRASRSGKQVAAYLKAAASQ